MLIEIDSKLSAPHDHLPTVNALDAIKAKVTGYHVECHSEMGKLVGKKSRGSTKSTVPFNMHGLFGAMLRAYYDHRKLIISPDMIWNTIVQGLSLHVFMNPEDMRSKFVKHQDKITLKVRRDDFVKGGVNPWPEVFETFNSLIAEHIGDRAQQLVPNFSTTGQLERAIHHVALMDSVQSYFKFEVYTLCGIPFVELEGTREDWNNLNERAKSLSDIIPAWWKDPLLETCQTFYDAACGKVDIKQWKSIFKEESIGSGSPEITGWALNLCPYLYDRYGKTHYPNPNLVGGRSYITSENLPSGVSQVPFEWFYYEQVFHMQFVGGFMGIIENDDFSVRPQFGWAIVESEEGLL